jgi:phage gp36-like protein
MAYSAVSDMLLGVIPTPSEEMGRQYVDDAANEIDIALGLRYVTPIVVDEAVAANRITVSWLQRINNFIASARWLMAVQAGAEADHVNAYAAQLLKEAQSALYKVTNGDIVLPGAPFINTDDLGVQGPVIGQQDLASGVDSFYIFTQRAPYLYPNPNPIFPAGGAPWGPPEGGWGNPFIGGG